MHKLNLTHSIIELYFFPKVHFTHNRSPVLKEKTSLGPGALDIVTELTESRGGLWRKEDGGE